MKAFKIIFVTVTLVFFIGSCKTQIDKKQNLYFEPTDIAYIEYNKIGWQLLKDKENVDGYTRIGDSIFGGEIACNIKPLKGIDINSFKVLAGTSYAKDKNYVYYPISVVCIDYEDCGVCYFSEIIMENANPESFKYIGKEYATDGKNVYFRGELIPNADGETFKVINGPEYFFFATDKNYVFKHNEKFDIADSKSFYYDKTDKRNIVSKYEHKFIIGDKNKEWEFIPPNTINEIKKE